jgi:hypothetical protein
VTYEDEYGDEWTSSVQTVDYFTECQTYTESGTDKANCLSTPNVGTGAAVDTFLESRVNSFNDTLAHLPNGVFPNHFVWGAAAELAEKKSSGAGCDLSSQGAGTFCNADATVSQTALHTYPEVGDADYVDTLDYRLDTGITSACNFDSPMGFDAADKDYFGLCFFVKMPSPGVRVPLRVNYWYQAQGNLDQDPYLFSEVSGQTNGFTTDEDLDDVEGLVVVQNLQSKRTWNSADGDLELSFMTEETNNLDYCSKRGLCDFESGICNCFSGFSGLRCETQNAVTYFF